MAVSFNGKIVGVNINGILTRELESTADVPWKCNHPKCANIINILGVASSVSDLFVKYPEADRILEIRIGVVAPAFRRQGISTELRRRTVTLAKELGIPLVKTDCVSAFAAKSVEGLGFQRVCRIPYADHPGPDGYCFAPPPPHDNAMQTFVYRVATKHRPTSL